VSMSGATATVASTTTGATIYYTVDGSDPRYSADAKTYTSAVTLRDGETIRAYAAKSEMFNSGVVEQTYSA